MNELTDRDESGLGWVYPPQPQQTFIQEIIGMISGVTELMEGQDYIDVGFGTSQPTADWVLIEASIFNTTDGTPINIWPGVLTSKTTTGFRLQLNGTPDSGNYFLTWSIRGVFGYYLSGPSSSRRNVASAPFTVRLPDESTLTGTVIITLSDGGVGGTFTPATVALTIAAPSATFTYTPSSYGPRSIGTDNDRGLIDPAEIGFTSIVSEYTLDGPTDGFTGQESDNFTVALPVGGSVIGSITITPDDGGDGGTFTPTTVELTTAASSATFTYTALSDGNKTISVTNNGGLNDPDSLAYTATTEFDPTSVAGLKLWLKADSLAFTDGTTVTTWPDSSANGYDLTGTATFKTNIVNGKPVLRFDNALGSNMQGTGALGDSQPLQIFIVAKITGGDAGIGGTWEILHTDGGIAMGTNNSTSAFLLNGSTNTGGTGAANAFHLFVFGADTGYGHLYIDAAGTIPGVNCGAGTVTVPRIGGFTLVAGDYAEILVYSPMADTSADISNIYSYFQDKYALTW